MMKYTQRIRWTTSITPTVPNSHLIALILLMLLLFSCRSSGEQGASTPSTELERIAFLMADLSPRDGNLFFFTAVTREQFRDRELEECRKEAAAQLSRYFAVNGVTYVRTRSLTSGTTVREAGEIIYNSDLADSLTDKLELVEEIRTDEGTCALYSYRPADLPSYPYKPAGGPDAPEWTGKDLNLDGYQSAIGFTGPKRFLERTIQQADKNALAALLEQNAGSLTTTRNEKQNSTGTRSDDLTTEKAAGTIRGAYIISRWQDEKGNMYSLALCPRKEE